MKTINFDEFDKYSFEMIGAIKSICSESGPWSDATDKEKIEAIRKELLKREDMRKTLS